VAPNRLEDAQKQRIYTALIALPRASLETVAAAVHLPEPAVLRVLTELKTEGLAAPVEDGEGDLWEAEPPDSVVAAQLDAEQRRLDEARETNRLLTQLYWTARRGAAQYPGLEVITDRHLIARQHDVILGLAKREVRSLSRPPFVYLSEGDALQRDIERQQRMMASGVSIRTIYYQQYVEDPVVYEIVQAYIAHGEDARVLADVPMKMLVADEVRAMLPLDPLNLTDGATLIVHPSGLLSALVSIFETLWRISAPTSRPDAGGSLTALQNQILTMLAAGATDEMIARHLGMSKRSVQRHCSAMFEQIGASTRFQAGALAAYSGLLQPVSRRRAIE